MSQDRNRPSRVVIIGGGISGLAAAWHVATRTVERGEGRPQVVVLEGSERYGGAVGTEHRDGFLLERGPDSFITSPGHMLRLIEELGLSDELVTPNRNDPPVYVWRDGLRAMPDAMMLVVPGDLDAFAASDLLEDSEKAAVRAEPDQPWGSVDDISMGAFFRARFGDAVTDQLVAPVLAGIYAGDVDRLSLRSTFPRFIDMVEEKGSLLAGAREWAAKRRGDLPFRSLRSGMGTLIDTLVAKLPGLGVELRAACPVRSVRPADQGWRVAVDDEELDADAVILAMPAYAAARVLGDVEPELAETLHEIPYTSTGCIYMAIEPEQAVAIPKAAGLLFPRSSDWTLKGIQLGANKFPGRAPEGAALMRVFMGGYGLESVLEHDDDTLIARCLDELERALGVALKPRFNRVFRYRGRTPQYLVGHADKVAGVLGGLPDDLYLTGSAYLGVGLPACVGTGRAAAERIVARL